jgi:hypothetical protein
MDDGGGATGFSSDVAKAAADRRPVYALLTAEGISQVVTIGMFFNPALRGMDVRREPVAEPTDGRAAAQAGETMVASRTTDIH